MIRLTSCPQCHRFCRHVATGLAIVLACESCSAVWFSAPDEPSQQGTPPLSFQHGVATVNASKGTDLRSVLHRELPPASCAVPPGTNRGERRDRSLLLG